MTEPTKAELQDRLDAAIKLNAHYERRQKEMDPEAVAIADCIKACSGFKTNTPYGYSQDKTDRAAIRRVLNATAARYGVQPDYEALARLVEQREAEQKLTEEERQELTRLRRLESVMDAARYGEPY